MTTRERFTASVEREIALLQQARDELKLQLNLAKTEATSEWKKLEANYEKLESELTRAREELRAPARELGSAAKGIIDELTRGYAQIREVLKGQR